MSLCGWRAEWCGLHVDDMVSSTPLLLTTEHHPYHNIRLEMERPDNDTHSATLQQEDHFNSTVVFVIKGETLILNKCNCILMMDMVFQNDGHLIQLTHNNVIK